MILVYFDGEGEKELMAMPVTHTRMVTINDRVFTIVDNEEFKRICELAGLQIKRAPVG